MNGFDFGLIYWSCRCSKLSASSVTSRIKKILWRNLMPLLWSFKPSLHSHMANLYDLNKEWGNHDLKVERHTEVCRVVKIIWLMIIKALLTLLKRYRTQAWSGSSIFSAVRFLCMLARTHQGPKARGFFSAQRWHYSWSPSAWVTACHSRASTTVGGGYSWSCHWAVRCRLARTGLPKDQLYCRTELNWRDHCH